MYRLPDLPACIPTLSNDDSKRLNAVFPNIKTPTNCITCGGKGAFRSYAPEGNEVVDWECNCPDQWVLHRYLLHCGIGTAYQRLGWRDAVAVEPGVVDLIGQYLDPEHVEAYVGSGMGLIFHGSMGNGKTLGSALLLKALLAQGYDGYFTTFAEMLSKLMASWSDPEVAKWFYARIRNADVLVIDDIGREHKQRRLVKGEGMKDFNTATSEFAFEDIVRHRISMALPTICTMNLDMEQLGQHYGPNLISLLAERSLIYEMKGGDFRDTARARVDDEIRQGIVRPVVLG